jgi:transcriptional regulator with XRE-family HTH domain/tetratricopeptide (TPR) repeat protein
VKVVANERLRAQRLAQGWSQEDVVRGLVRVGIEVGERQLGVTRNLVSRWEREGTIPRAPYPKLLCLLFQTSAEELGLVVPYPPATASITIEEDRFEDGGDEVERRDFLRVAGTAVVGAFLPWKAWPLPDGSLDLDDLVSITSRYCRLAPTVPSARLLEARLAHLRILMGLVGSARSEATRARVAAAVNQAAAFAGRLAFDLGDYAAFHRYYRLAVSYAKRAGDDALASYTLGSMSYWSVMGGDDEQALTTMEHAKSLFPKQVPPVVESWFAVFEASVQSKAGGISEAMAALGRAEEAIAKDQEPWAWTLPLDFGRLTRHRGFCATRLGLPAVSIPALRHGLDELGPHEIKWRALALSDLANSYILTGEIEEACGAAGEAFDTGIQLQSDRVLKRVARIRRELGPWKETKAVRELEERMGGGFLGNS